MSVPANHPVRGTATVVVVGTLNIDVVWPVATLPRPGETIMAGAAKRQFGGKGANQATAAARHGARVALVGAVGSDADGAAYLERLRIAQIDTTWIARIPDTPTGAAHIYVDGQGENSIIVNPGANGRLAAAQVEAALTALLPAAGVLLLQQESPPDVVRAALASAQRFSTRVVLNASPVDADFRWGRHDIDTVVVNEHECARYFGHEPARWLAMAAGERHRALESHRVRNLVITQGARPTLHLAAGRVTVAPPPAVKPVDTVGAGDTFAGVLATQLAEGADWESALAAANAAAALSTLALGAQTAMPTRAAVAEFRSNQASTIVGPG